MKKVIEIREFDAIPNDKDKAKGKDFLDKDFKEWSDYEWQRMYDELRKFVLSDQSDDNEEDSRYFGRLGQKKKTEVIIARNYVGVVQLKSGYQIQILPKIDFADESEYNKDNKLIETKKIFKNMLKELKEFKCKQLNTANLQVEKMSIFEIFIYIFLGQIDDLVRKGLKSAYIQVENNVPYYKGKLLVSQHIRYNMAHAERFYVSYDEFHINRPENCLLKAALIKLQRLSTDFSNQKKIRQLLLHFELVEPSTSYEADFAKVIIDRNTQAYERPLKWAKVFLLGKSFTSFTGKADATSLLFPMDRLFEAYIAKMFVRSEEFSDWDISVQDYGCFLFNEPEDKFRLRPDIVLKKNNKCIIVDTKWKRLKNDKSKNYGISQSDMYQMYAYSKMYHTPYICLLYPFNNDMKTEKNEKPISVEVYKKTCKQKTEIEIHILMIDLSKPEKFNELFDYIKRITYMTKEEYNKLVQRVQE